MFENVVLAGGGCRCFWQLGVWSRLAPELGLEPRQMTGVSAGSAMALAIALDATEETLERFKEATSRNPRNVYPRNLLRRERPSFPHYAMYRGTLLDILTSRGDPLPHLARGPELNILLARAPRGLGPRAAVLVGFLAYSVEKKLRRPVHASWARSLGFRGEVVRAQDCESADALADAVMASSCTPPFTPVQIRDGLPALDGGLVDGVPVSILPEERGRTLVLLTRRYPALHGAHKRVYLQPSRPVPVSKWDYTSPERLQATYDQGREDAEAFLLRTSSPTTRPHAPS